MGARRKRGGWLNRDTGLMNVAFMYAQIRLLAKDGLKSTMIMNWDLKTHDTYIRHTNPEIFYGCVKRGVTCIILITTTSAFGVLASIIMLRTRQFNLP